MTETAISLPKSVERGQVWQLGRHRLMCGDATNKEDVAKLFAGERPTLVVTSPPYAKQRDYDRPIVCWDNLMMEAFNGHSFTDDVQILVNLGIVHQQQEIVFYWQEWLNLMRNSNWKIRAQYIWDKVHAVPGVFKGRLSPSHEFVFHFSKQSVDVKKWVACLRNRKSVSICNLRKKNGLPKRERIKQQTQALKPARSVITAGVVRFGEATGHPAQMPIALCCQLIRSWRDDNSIVYDPFCGAGTTLLAADRENVTSLGMEISSAYCAIILSRWNKQEGVTPAYLVDSASSSCHLNSHLQTTSMQPLGAQQ